jgi:4-diphosphocytidyl-2-C-methyl-D-erythritol kinase
VNLFLEILGKRPDGYHELATLIVPVNLYDSLEIHPAAAGEIHLTCVPPTLPAGPTNLVWKAADGLRRTFGVTAGASIRLAKRIPHEAGLGGGSSDAAATIAALNAVWGLNRTVEELAPVAAAVGSDVPAFLVCGEGDLTPRSPLQRGEGEKEGASLPLSTLERGPGGEVSCFAAWCTGRGEIVTPVPIGAPLHLVIVKPPVGCPTAEVYRRVTVPNSPLAGDEALAALASGDPARVAAALHNRLQPAAFDLQPVVRRVYDRLNACDPLGCLLSGSGACVFAVCRDRADAVRVARRFEADPRGETPDCRVSVVRTPGAMT